MFQHSDARLAKTSDDFRKIGAKAGREAFQKNPNLLNAEVAALASDAALLYLMSAPDGVEPIMSGFKKAYADVKKQQPEEAHEDGYDAGN